MVTRGFLMVSLVMSLSVWSLALGAMVVLYQQVSAELTRQQHTLNTLYVLKNAVYQSKLPDGFEWHKQTVDGVLYQYRLPNGMVIMAWEP